MSEATVDDPSQPADPEAAAASSGPSPAPRGPAFVLAVSFAVLFAVLAAILAVVAAGGDDGDGRTDELRRVAGRFGEAFLTYDYEDPDAHRDAVLDLSTGSFSGEYEDAFDQGLIRLITDARATSEGTVKEVYVSQLDDERGEAIVLADAARDGTGGPRNVFDIYIKLTLVEVGGSWKVDDVEDLKFTPEGASVGGEDPASTSTTSATVPVP